MGKALLSLWLSLVSHPVDNLLWRRRPWNRLKGAEPLAQAWLLRPFGQWLEERIWNASWRVRVSGQARE